MRIASLLFALGLATPGCTMTGINDAPPPTPDTCGMERVAALIGEPRSVLDALDLQGPVRVLRPGDAMTMDLIVERLNIFLDDADRIESIRCG